LKEINYIFKGDSLNKIVERLQEVSSGKIEGLDQDFAKKTLTTMSKHSPLSMSVVFE